MKYVGSKRKLAKYLLPIILKDRQPGQFYVEPFAGGMNTIIKVTGPRIANDANKHIITLYKELQKGWIPPNNITEEEYKNEKNNQCNTALTAFIGFGCSFGAKFFGGYARSFKADKTTPRNHCLEAKKALLKEVPLIKDVFFINKEYHEFHIPKNSIVYCDPPYKNTLGYGKGFDHDLFWDWVRELSLMGHKVFVSEYEAPNDFKCVFRQDNPYYSLNHGNTGKIEKLFVYEVVY